jgi:hypothetical protein
MSHFLLVQFSIYSDRLDVVKDLKRTSRVVFSEKSAFGWLKIDSQSAFDRLDNMIDDSG